MVIWSPVNRQGVPSRADLLLVFLVPWPLQVHGVRGVWVWIQILLLTFPMTLGKSFNLFESPFLLRTTWETPI